MPIKNEVHQLESLTKGSSRLCVIIFADEILKCLLGKTFRAILVNKSTISIGLVSPQKPEKPNPCIIEICMIL